MDLDVVLVVDADADVVVCLYAPEGKFGREKCGFVQAHDSDYVSA